MLTTSSATRAGSIDNERYLLNLERLEALKIMCKDIESKTEAPRILLIYGKPISDLSNEVKIALNMVLHEHGTAPEQQRRETFDQLEDRLQEFSRTAEHCKQLVDKLHGRGKFMAKLMRVWDLRKIRELQAEVKTRGADLERSLTRLKIRQPNDDGQFTRTGNETLEDHEEQWQGSRSSNVSSSGAPGSSRMNPATTLNKAAVRGGHINTVGNDLYQFRNVYIYNSPNTSVHFDN
ncbi:hypothetical protein GYMLUDRAFT_256556 [Collybiopsis luxurians FD-317 M1]|nr:hypothetical protein GYMLUDRAFT_256556 [Collybiopsis luxurians FD-317 M1]